MKLEKLVVTARASLNYNVGEVSLEVSEFQKEDLSAIKQLVVSEAIKCVKLIDANLPKDAQAPANAQPQVQYNQAPVKMASEAQLKLLHQLGYNCDTPLTSKQASDIIAQLKKGQR